MTQRNHDSSGSRSFAFIFLLSFGLLTLVAAWFLYGEIAQSLTKTGQCTVLSSQVHQATAGDTSDASLATAYDPTFQLSLRTSDGQELQVPGIYSSSNFVFPDQKSAKAILQRYPVGSTTSCNYTYLDPSGIKAIFAPEVPIEGLALTSFFFLVGLIVSIICIKALRTRPASPVIEAEPIPISTSTV